ncbi:MAG: AMP-binding protein, partial [Gammaproteobacteria bacterium]
MPVNIGLIPAKHAALAPGRTALIDVPSGRRMSFGELDERVRRLANGLSGLRGVEKGARVAILAKNCIEYLELMFACARIGLIAQPLNWRLAVPEMANIVRG